MANQFVLRVGKFVPSLCLLMILNTTVQPEDFVLWTGKRLNEVYRIRGVSPYTHGEVTYSEVVERKDGNTWMTVQDNEEARDVFDAFMVSAFRVPEGGTETVFWDLSKPVEVLAEAVQIRWPGRFVRLNSDRVSAWVHDGSTVYVVLRANQTQDIRWMSKSADGVGYRIRTSETSSDIIEKYDGEAWKPVEHEGERLDVRYMHLDDMFSRNGAPAPTFEMDLTLPLSYILREVEVRFPGYHVRFRSDLKLAWVHDAELRVYATLVHRPSNVVWVSRTLESTAFRVRRKEGVQGVRKGKCVERLTGDVWAAVDFVTEMAVLDLFLEETFFRMGEGIETYAVDLTMHPLKLYATVHTKWPNAYTKIIEDRRTAWVYGSSAVRLRTK